MTYDLSTIPEERLAILDGPLFKGAHGGGGSDCRHCAREALHEALTGVHQDATPPGCSALLSTLPVLNDGPWRDDAHRTAVIGPYMRRLALTTPEGDQERMFKLLNYVFHVIFARTLRSSGLPKQALKIDELPTIVDADTAAMIEKAVAMAAKAVREGAAKAVEMWTVEWTLKAVALAGATAGGPRWLAAARVAAAATAAAKTMWMPAYWENDVRAILDIICS